MPNYRMRCTRCKQEIEVTLAMSQLEPFKKAGGRPTYDLCEGQKCHKLETIPVPFSFRMR